MVMIKQRCDFCDNAAIVDGKTTFGPWAFMCSVHFEKYGDKAPGMFTRLNVPNQLTLPKKKCVVCGEYKPLTDFYTYRDRHGVERKRNDCKTCNLAAKKKAAFK